MRRIIAGFVIAFPLALGAVDQRDELLQSIDARRATYADIAKQIWAFAEVGYQEQKSSALLQQQLKAAGFTLRAGVADIPTAFVGSFGSGKPVVAKVRTTNAYYLIFLWKETVDGSYILPYKRMFALIDSH